MEPAARFEALSAEECKELLQSRSVGRLAVVVGGYPHIFPVNYRVAGDGIIFSTNEGTKLAGADLGRVAFEVDEIAPDGMSGWSVVVHGTAYDISGAVDSTSLSLKTLDVNSAIGAVRRVRIVSSEITGRRLSPPARSAGQP